MIMLHNLISFVTSSADFLRMGDGVEKSHNDITNVLFCGFHFPASQNYTREYLKGYPFIKVSLSLSPPPICVSLFTCKPSAQLTLSSCTVRFYLVLRITLTL